MSPVASVNCETPRAMEDAEAESARPPTVAEYYAGRTVLITGGTGFMGQLLIERLLCLCPGVRRVAVLLRARGDAAPHERLALLKQGTVFDSLRKRAPSQLEKVVSLAGDVTLPQLGIHDRDMHMLDDVSVVFHCAATVRFAEPLRRAADLNLRPVLRLADLCDGLPNMEVLVHVSTAYSNCELSTVAERVYPPPLAPERLLQLLDALDDDRLEAATEQLISPKPNTYTFTKALAESALHQRPRRHYRTAIFRPSIVVSTLRHPVAGWVMGRAGPAAVVMAVGAGVQRVIRADPVARAHLLPADLAIHTLIAVGWDVGVNEHTSFPVYNCCGCRSPPRWRRFERALNRHCAVTPQDHALWYPHIRAVSNRYSFAIMEFFLQKVPMYAAEWAKRVLRIKTRLDLIQTYGRLHRLTTEFAPFAVREWRFETARVDRLRRRLAPDDRDTFDLQPDTIDWDAHFAAMISGVRRHVLRERDAALPRARRRMQRLRVLYVGTNSIALLLLLRLIIRNRYIRDFVIQNIILFITRHIRNIYTKLRGIL